MKDETQAAAIEALPLDGVACERPNPLACRLAFDRGRYATGDVIRRVVAVADVRDIQVEEESIESIIRRVYTDKDLLAAG